MSGIGSAYQGHDTDCPRCAVTSYAMLVTEYNEMAQEIAALRAQLDESRAVGARVARIVDAACTAWEAWNNHQARGARAAMDRLGDAIVAWERALSATPAARAPRSTMAAWVDLVERMVAVFGDKPAITPDMPEDEAIAIMLQASLLREAMAAVAAGRAGLGAAGAEEAG